MVWKIFKRDLRRILRNFVALVVIIGVCFIPALYAWFNIYANIDPYNNTKNIRVAVVNADQGAYSKVTGPLELGNQVQRQLRKNHQLGWRFVSAENAREGVANGEYYAAIVIPEGFSRSIISVLSGKIKRPRIEYYCNEKKNAISPKVTDSGATALQTRINETFVKVVSGVVSDTIDRTGGSLAGRMEQSRRRIDRKLQHSSEELGKYDAVLTRFRRTSGKARETLRAFGGALDQLDQSAEAGRKTLDDTDRALKNARTSTAFYTKQLNRSLDSLYTSLETLRSDTARAAAGLSTPYDRVSGQLQQAVTELTVIVSLNSRLIEDMQELNRLIPGSPASDTLDKLTAENRKAQELLRSLTAAGDRIDHAQTGAKQFGEEMNRLMDGNALLLQQARRRWFGQGLPLVEQTLDSYGVLSASLRGVLNGVPAETARVRTLLRGMSRALDDADRSLQGTSRTIRRTKNTLDAARADLNTIAGSGAYRNLLSRSKGSTEKLSEFLASPIQLKTETTYPVRNYGSAMMPFYTNLALWVSGIILAAILKLRVDADDEIPEFTGTQAYFGRGLLFVLLGQIQALIILTGDLLLPGIQCQHPGMFILAGMASSFVYINLIYALTLTFNHLGRAIVVFLVILQIPGSSGTYPIEMLPRFFRILHPMLPFTYSINAMRETIAGYYGHHYGKNLGILMIFLGVALLLGLVIQPLIMNMNNMFDDRLSQTGLMMSERENDVRPKANLSHILWVLTEEKATRDVVMERAVSFEKKYPRRIRYGFLLYILLPLFFLVLAFRIEAKLLFLILWVTSIVVISICLIALEYIHETVQQRLGIRDTPQEELVERIRELMRDRRHRRREKKEPAETDEGGDRQ